MKPSIKLKRGEFDHAIKYERARMQKMNEEMLFSMKNEKNEVDKKLKTE
jgi:hypothetical protein